MNETEKIKVLREALHTLRSQLATHPLRQHVDDVLRATDDAAPVRSALRR